MSREDSCAQVPLPRTRSRRRHRRARRRPRRRAGAEARRSRTGRPWRPACRLTRSTTTAACRRSGSTAEPAVDGPPALV